jgi:hypothetical protein
VLSEKNVPAPATDVLFFDSALVTFRLGTGEGAAFAVTGRERLDMDSAVFFFASFLPKSKIDHVNRTDGRSSCSHDKE